MTNWEGQRIIDSHIPAKKTVCQRRFSSPLYNTKLLSIRVNEGIKLAKETGAIPNHDKQTYSVQGLKLFVEKFRQCYFEQKPSRIDKSNQILKL